MSRRRSETTASIFCAPGCISNRVESERLDATRSIQLYGETSNISSTHDSGSAVWRFSVRTVVMTMSSDDDDDE